MWPSKQTKHMGEWWYIVKPQIKLTLIVALKSFMEFLTKSIRKIHYSGQTLPFEQCINNNADTVRRNISLEWHSKQIVSIFWSVIAFLSIRKTQNCQWSQMLRYSDTQILLLIRLRFFWRTVSVLTLAISSCKKKKSLKHFLYWKNCITEWALNETKSIFYSSNLTFLLLSFWCNAT